MRMLFGDRTKYVTLVLGLAFAALLMNQQGAIFLGLLAQATGPLQNVTQPDLWVTDPDTPWIAEYRSLEDRKLARVRSVPGVEWAEPFVKLRLPHIVNLRRDPFERADFNSNTYWDWMVNHVPQMYEMQEVVGSEIENFVKFPPRQKPASFNLDSVLAQVQTHK